MTEYDPHTAPILRPDGVVVIRHFDDLEDAQFAREQFALDIAIFRSRFPDIALDQI